MDEKRMMEGTRTLTPKDRAAFIKTRVDEPKSKSPMPTLEELVLIRTLTILPMILTITENSLRKIDVTENTLNKLYKMVTNQLINRIIADIQSTKKELREAGIKVYEDETADNNLRVKFICRGYHDDVTFTRDVIKSEIVVKLQKYIVEFYK
ncbi:hypothetical protein [Paenibacillus lutrae]|uniref:Uncharacterized protein n=1 Tax=Paenibacillus lutrae TaxID=2078573 RepID=A0A7X3JZS4_9BACL|nr:hypothetical protein [Paenibacillus lutrae]MVP00337.1 hypothetical protein [Paenibacillus lutrae]